jgi:hypothetical protein
MNKMRTEEEFKDDYGDGVPQYRSRRDFIPLDSVDALVLERDPTFEKYLFFHNLLDKFCWCAKLHYSDRETVKKKRYRLDVLFQDILTNEAISLEKAGRCIDSNTTEEQLEYHITKGWLNELVRSHPLHPDYLAIGTNLGQWSTPGSGGFASWNIIQSYYAFYEYLATICVAVDSTAKADGHKVVAKSFNNHVIGKALGRLVFYPFNLTSSTSSFPSHPKHCEFHYATYPREVGRNINELEHELVQAYKLLSAENRGTRTSVFDLFYELRLWSNYTGVQSIITLSDGGYQKFLSRNLSTLAFLAGGMAEIAYIARFGSNKYLGMLKRFSVSYIDKHESFARNKFLIPPYIRLRILKHLSLFESRIDFIIPQPVDPVVLIGNRSEA